MSTLVADTGQGGSVYTMEVSKRCKYALPLLCFRAGCSTFTSMSLIVFDFPVALWSRDSCFVEEEAQA